MRQGLLIALFLFAVSEIVSSQKVVTVDLPNQPYPGLYFSFSYQRVASYPANSNGQVFCFHCKNQTDKPKRLTFDLIAYTVCGSEVKQYFDIRIEANQELGDLGNFMNSDFTGSVTPSECKGETISYNDNGENKTGINRIKRLAISNLKVNDYSGSKATKANDISNVTVANNNTPTNNSKNNPNTNSSSSTTGNNINNTLPNSNSLINNVNSTNAQTNQIIAQANNNLNTALANNQRKYENNVVLINSIKDLAISFSQSRLQSDLAKIDNFYDAQKGNFSVADNLISQFTSAYDIGDTEQVFKLSVAIANEKAEQGYNDFNQDFGNGYLTFKSKDDPSSNSKLDGYFFYVSMNGHALYYPSELPNKLPDITRLPALKAFKNDFPRNPVYDTAFGWLRDCSKDYIIFSGEQHKIKCAKKANTLYNEDSAIAYLTRAVNQEPIHTPYDLCDYATASLWITYLRCIKATTLQDVYQNVNTIHTFFKNMPDVSNILGEKGYGDKKYISFINKTMIFFGLYEYYRIYQNCQDQQLRSTLYNRLPALLTACGAAYLSNARVPQKWVHDFTKESIQLFFQGLPDL